MPRTDPATPPPRTIARLLRFWLGFRDPVRRGPYALTGFGLALFKYLVDNALVASFDGRWWSPLDYLSPLGYGRLAALSPGVLWILLVWTIPFLWIGASLTVRRSFDAGLGAGLGLLFFVPGLNYLLMLLLCVLPSRWGRRRSDLADLQSSAAWADASFYRSVSFGALIGLAAAAVGIGWLGSYGWGLFLGGPFVMGFGTAWLYDSRCRHPLAASVGTVQMTVVVTGGALLIFGVEGGLCLAMAAPIACGLAFLGGLLGRAMAGGRRMRMAEALIALLAAPLWMALGRPITVPLREVVTVVEIDAPPQVVWPHVTAFTELPPPSRLFFKLGIAYPLRARYVGHGPGAVRTCEFSTGAFVEPVTVWDEPRRLAFDVAAQPPTMEEWSPYRHLSPPHVTESLQTERGEFRLVALPGGRTRLEGSTWYRLELFPQLYWTLWSDALIHGIHRRVLDHIRSRSEQEPREGGL